MLEDCRGASDSEMEEWINESEILLPYLVWDSLFN